MELRQILIVLVIGGLQMVSGCKKPETNMVMDRSDLVGMSLAVVTNQLGTPYRISDFTVGTAPTKNWHHSIIFGTYPKSNPNNLDVHLKELVWQDGEYTIHACFHMINDMWVVLGANRLHKNVIF